MVALIQPLALGRWMKCVCGHRWDSYPVGYQATISGQTTAGAILIKFDCPECHSWLVRYAEETAPMVCPRPWTVTCRVVEERGAPCRHLCYSSFERQLDACTGPDWVV